ncbi:hypothetical protein GCM10008013_50490 [Paenibacillus segetis]|uniref:Gram-positive cocci surface proteins LPxTG domain-containing protein n=1 Tax=Paenibacillus segetis TaxID=1325360 RepID=A0ABQ1YVW7_9BACL|nr:hypothetical protein GCM10008013_50490 [Paenibacillus segetis]
MPEVVLIPEDQTPKGSVVAPIETDAVGSGTNETLPDEEVPLDKLPKTGESSALPFYLIGFIMIAVGYIFKKTGKRN